MPPLPPVTRARAEAGVEYDAGASAQQRLHRVPHRELVQHGAAVTGDALGAGDEVGLEVIEPRDVEGYVAHAGEVTERRADAAAHAACNTAHERCAGGDQGAMHRHSLRGVLDAAGGAEPPVGAQRIVGGAVRRTATADALRVPGQHLFEQAHASLVRDMLLDPLVV
jgi:hypothetical protein